MQPILNTIDSEILQVLVTCPLFEGLQSHEIERILTTVPCRLVSLPKGKVYVYAGDRCRYADIVVRGELNAEMMGKSGKSVQMDARRSGQMLAPAFIFAKQHTIPVTITASQDAVLLRMMPYELKKLIDTDERIRYNFISLLSQISTFLASKVSMLSLHSAREKVAMLLLQEAHRQNTDIITLNLTRQETADRLGIQKYSLQRCLAEMVEQGLVRIEGKKIILLNKSQLMHFI